MHDDLFNAADKFKRFTMIPALAGFSRTLGILRCEALNNVACPDAGIDLLAPDSLEIEEKCHFNLCAKVLLLKQ